MSDKEQRIRDAAKELHDAISDGRKSGLRIEWPGSTDGLPSIGISEAGPVVERVAVVAKLADEPVASQTNVMPAVRNV